MYQKFKSNWYNYSVGHKFRKKDFKIMLAGILLKKDTNMTLAQAKEAEQALLHYFEILYKLKQKEK